VKTHTANLRSAKTRKLTLGEARQAARIAKGSRPTGTFIAIDSGKGKALRKRFLGEIVHVPAAGPMSSRSTASNGALRKRAVTGKVAKKK